MLDKQQLEQLKELRKKEIEMRHLILPGILRLVLTPCSRDPWEMLKDGDFSHIPLMIGTNQDEGELAVCAVLYKSRGSLVQFLLPGVPPSCG